MKQITDTFNTCPVCDSSEIEGGSMNIDDNSASQSIQCLNCKAEWDEVYTPAYRLVEDNLTQARMLWSKLGDVPTMDETLDEDFIVFEGEESEELFQVGTDIYDVWHWFEERFNISVAVDLMGQ